MANIPFVEGYWRIDAALNPAISDNNALVDKRLTYLVSIGVGIMWISVILLGILTILVSIFGVNMAGRRS
jgi:hypothetical protein